MDFILLSFGSSGDINPFIKLGSALKNRNHHVTFITNEFFREQIELKGIDFYKVGEKDEYESLINNPKLFNPQKAFSYVVKNFILKNMRESYFAIKKLATAQTTIIAQSIVPGARIAHEKLKIPLITLNLQPVSFWSVDKPPVFSGLEIPPKWPFLIKKALLSAVDKLVIDKQFAPEINKFLNQLDLMPQKHFFTRWFYSPQAIVGLFPDWFAEPASDWPANVMLPGFISLVENKEMPAGLREFIAKGEPPIVFTAGSAMQHAVKFYKTAIEYARSSKSRIIIITNYKNQLENFDDENIFHCDFAPFDKLFTLVAAVVHHGGIGTIAPAIAAAKPQLIVPFAHDQPDNASRIQKLGLGLVLKPSQFSARLLATKLKELISSESITENCQEYSAKIDYEGSLNRLLNFIESKAIS